jgi:hypothetical protein
MRRARICFALTLVFLLGATFAVVFLNASLATRAQAETRPGDAFERVKKAISDSRLDAGLKRHAESKSIYGKVYCVWPMSDGTFLFEVSTSTGGYAFTIKTGDLKAEGMVKVRLLAYEKQTPVWVFEDSDHPHVASSIVSVTL